ncbi:MAG: hypothetical protein HKN71_04010, partial [Gemmatimonadetes bacterium]|nr:hypothetical protein [Gemmatimonadota bacterium]
GVVVLKLLLTMMAPLFGMAVGLLMLGLKVLFWGAIAYVVYRVFFRKRRETAEV